MVNAPDSLSEFRSHLSRAMSEMSKRYADYVAGKEYYDGTRAEIAASSGVEAIIRKSAADYPVSLAHIPVDVIADKVELASLTATDGAAKDALTTIFDVNDLEDECDDWVRKAGYFGDYYVITDPTEEELDGEAAAITADGIRLAGSSPLTTIVVYDAAYGRTKLYGAKVWTVGNDDDVQTKARLFYDDGTVKLITAKGKKTPKASDFDFDIDIDQEAADAFIPHPGGRMLIAHLAIDGKPYGTPLHRKAWGPQDAITKVSATNLSNVDGQGFASRWALADPLAEIDDDIDDDFGDAGPTAPGTTPSDGITAATNGTARRRSIPGAIEILRGIKQVGQFDATGSDDFLKNLDWYVRVMAVACGIPLFEFDLKGEQPSGESRRRAEGRANKKAAKVKRQAGAFLRDIGDTALALLGMSGEVQATFNPSETSTDKDGLELVSMKIKAGVPVPQALLEAGYTDEQVEEWFEKDAPHVTPELLAILATALQQLGQAKTLGVIGDEELRDMLPTILTAARGEGAPIATLAAVESVDPGVDEAAAIKAKADAMGALVRAGADQTQAAAYLGLDGIDFPNVPTTVRIPEEEAEGLEGAGAA